jgi:hypothetical protein
LPSSPLEALHAASLEAAEENGIFCRLYLKRHAIIIYLTNFSNSLAAQNGTAVRLAIMQHQ